MTNTPHDLLPPSQSWIGRRQVLLGGAAAGALIAARGRRAVAAGESVLTFGLANWPINLRPHENTGTAAATVKLQLFRGLLGYDSSGKITGELAEAWENETPTIYEFKLRSNAKFQDGNPVTSADVKKTIELITGEKSTAYLRDALSIVEKIETPDDRTVRFTLKAPSATFLLVLASPYAPILSAKALAANPAAPVGAGPYKLDVNEKGARIEVTRFADFYKPGLPKIDRLRFVLYADDNSRVAALQAGDVDIIEYVPWQNMEGISANPKLRLDNVEGPYLITTFNMKTGPFADVRLRRAVAYAINRNDVIKGALSGHGVPLGGIPNPRSAAGYDPALDKLWSYDPDKAKALLRDAGFPNGFSTSLLCTPASTSISDSAQVVQQNLAAIGIQVEVKVNEWASYISYATKGQYEMAIIGSGGDFNDPDALSGLIATGAANYHKSFGFSDPRIDAVLAQGRGELDPEKRKQIYQKLPELVAETVPLVGLCWRTQGYGMQAYVKNFHNLPDYLSFFSGWTLEQTSLDKAA